MITINLDTVFKLNDFQSIGDTFDELLPEGSEALISVPYPDELGSFQENFELLIVHD